MTNQNDDIKAIREMMERSSKFLSLSGLSGIIVGCIATAGAAIAYFYLLGDPSPADDYSRQEMLTLLADAVLILVVSVATGLCFSARKARKSGQKLFNRTTYRLIYNLAIPLVSGGAFCLVYLLKGDLHTAISGTLLFYGLALVNASKYTYREIHHLGLIEIAFGLAAALCGQYGLLFWTLGFGACHIVYGTVMYLKYDRKK